MTDVVEEELGTELCFYHNLFLPSFNFQKRELFDDDYQVYYDQYFLRKKFPSGMTAEIGFDPSVIDNVLFWNISLVIFNKRKQAWKEDKVCTGRDGLEPLVWAKTVIKFAPYFFDRVHYNGLNKDHFGFIVGYSDDRRFHAYQLGLRDLGFVVDGFSSGRELVKIVDRSDFSDDPLYCFSFNCQ